MSAPESDPAAKVEDAVVRGDARAALKAADEWLRRDDVGRAIPAIERAVEAFPEDVALLARLLEACLKRGDWARFDERVERGTRRFPGHADLWFLKGRAQEFRGHVCAAIRAYGHAFRRDRDELEPVQRIARLFRARARPFLARRRLRRALKHAPDSAALHAAIGYAYIDDGQHAKAVNAFHRAVKIEPEDSPYLDDLGGALLLSERWKEAANVATRSLKTRPGNEKSWTVYAVAHRHLGDDERAEKGYRKAVESARDPARAKGNLGLFLALRAASNAQLKEAASCLRAALDVHPEWDEVRDALESLE